MHVIVNATEATVNIKILANTPNTFLWESEYNTICNWAIATSDCGNFWVVVATGSGEHIKYNA